MNWTDFNETIYPSSYLIGVDEVSDTPLRNITLLALLNETNCLTNNDGVRIPQMEIDQIKTLAVVWNYGNDSQHEEMHIHQIYNHDTGEIYWDYESMGNMDWTDNDDKLVSSLLMWGNLESTIDGPY